jgi:hypothetical protein
LLSLLTFLLLVRSFPTTTIITAHRPRHSFIPRAPTRLKGPTSPPAVDQVCAPYRRAADDRHGTKTNHTVAGRASTSIRIFLFLSSPSWRYHVQPPLFPPRISLHPRLPHPAPEQKEGKSQLTGHWEILYEVQRQKKASKRGSSSQLEPYHEQKNKPQLFPPALCTSCPVRWYPRLENSPTADAPLMPLVGLVYGAGQEIALLTTGRIREEGEGNVFNRRSIYRG